MWWRKVGEKELAKRGMKSAAGVITYIALVATFMNNAERWFGKMDNNVLAPVLFLSLLSTSVLICALLVLSGPYQLFVDKKGKEALALVMWTAKWLAAFVVLVVVGLLLWR